MASIDTRMVTAVKPHRFTQSHAVILTCAVLCLIVAAPVMAMSLPWFGDLFFHMARMVVLENPSAPYVSEWYHTDWRLVPNLAMDLVVPILGAAVRIEVATRAFLAATFVLTLTGTLALHRSLHKKVEWFPLVACLFVYNWIVFAGFANFLFGIGLALWALAIWFACQDRPLPVRLALGTVAALALYTCHLFTLGLYALVVASGEFSLFWHNERRRAHDLARGILAATIPFLVPLALLLTSRTVAASSTPTDYVMAAKVFSLLVPFITGNLPVDLVIAAATVALAYVLVRENALNVAPAMRLALIAMPILIVVIPTSPLGADLADFRLPAAAIFVAIAACRFSARAGRPFRMGVAACLACLFALRMTGVAIDFATAEPEIQAITQQYRLMKPGAVVFTGTFEHKSFVTDLFAKTENWFPLWRRRNTVPFRHIGTVALLYQPVFVPETMVIDGQQPIAIVPVYRRLKALQSLNDVARLLVDAGDVDRWLAEIRDTISRPPYHFTAVYITLSDPDGIAKPPAGVSELFSDYHYRIWDATALVTR